MNTKLIEETFKILVTLTNKTPEKLKEIFNKTFEDTIPILLKDYNTTEKLKNFIETTVLYYETEMKRKQSKEIIIKALINIPMLLKFAENQNFQFTGKFNTQMYKYQRNLIKIAKEKFII